MNATCVPGANGKASHDAGAPHELLFEKNPNPMWVVDAATLAFVSVNDAAVARYGYPRDEFLTKTIHDIRAPEEQPRLDAWLARSDDTGAAPVEARHRTKSGDVIDVEIHATRFEAEGRRRTLVCAVEVTARKRAETEARAAERRLQMLMEKHFDGVSLSAADGAIEYVNSALTRILGRDPREAIGQFSGAWLHPDDAAREQSAFVHVMRTPNASHTAVVRNLHADGSWRWVESTTTNLLDDPDVRAIVATFRDVTDRVRAEQELRKAHARLEHLLSATSAVIFAVRGTSGESGITFMSENAAAVLGYEAREFIENRALWRDNVHPDDRDRAEISSSVSRGRGHEYRFRHKDGRTLWLHDEMFEQTDERGEKEFIGCCFDITARKELEEALRRSERDFRALLDHLPSGVFVQRRGRIVYANQTMATLLGYGLGAAMRGLTPFDLSPPETHEAIRGRVRALESQSRSYNPPLTGEMVRRDGSRVAVEVESLGADFDGEPSVVALVRDVSERREMFARMALADRMRSVGMLAAGVAHEINNPLAYVLNNVEMLERELGSAARTLRPSEIQQLLRDARDGAMRVRDTVRDLRMLSRDDGDAVGSTDLRVVLESCMKIAAKEVRYRARLVVQIEPTPPVRGTDSRLGQVFLNLLINAAHAIPEGHADENEITVRARQIDPNVVLVEIADTGCGISPAVIGRIFDPFFTTKPPGIGTGLGLAICHGIVKSLGGTIDVESEPGRGTTFRVLLPVAPDLERRDEPSEASASAPRLRILVVDDEPAIGTSLRLMLKGEHDVAAVTCAREALSRIEAGEDYDLVLCDLMMPQMNGMDLFAAVEKSCPALASRFVFLTGGAFTDASREFLALNTNPHLEKPFTPKALQDLFARSLPR